MPSPAMTMIVLVVLWAIVVVPMVLRRNDERQRERTVDGFGRAMRALGRRPVDDKSDAEVYVPIAHRRDEPGPVQGGIRVPAAARRPVPAAQEALMYPPDRDELSEARVQMLRRRRRSLSILVGGTALFLLLGAISGGAMWALFTVFLLGLAGYTWFLRSQALRDRSRRENRQLRAAERRHDEGRDVTDEQAEEFERRADSVVRIDDDDFALMSSDTIDLTPFYESEAGLAASQRRAS